jgi:glycosyltransferase involved in cell wall biosynthesis
VLVAWWHPWFWGCYSFITQQLKKSAIPFFFLCHNCYAHDTKHFSKKLTQSLLSAADGLIFLSKFSQNCWARPKPPNRSLFHPLYEWPEWPVRQCDKWSKRILIAGYLRGYKGIDLALNLLWINEEIRLTIVGDAFDKAIINNINKIQAQNENRVTMIPEYCKDAALVKFIDSHDLALLPYRRATQSGIIATALGRSRPVVATPVGGLPEQINIGAKVGVVAKDMSPEALNMAISEIYDSPPSFWANEIESIRQDWSWERMSKQLLHCIQNWLPEKPYR